MFPLPCKQIVLFVFCFFFSFRFIYYIVADVFAMKFTAEIKYTWEGKGPCSKAKTVATAAIFSVHINVQYLVTGAFTPSVLFI